eukprot:TRINITY_DN36731_c0_g1_i1.p1 TRINITY_DN36731_c0_g1~~TRINITY_DN36731_c0_g1_i1.p1  ORF type:complete len:531 (+),score=115.78 TRINITY_DN36731_c0_g1_i1:158-1750(+)
MVSASPSFKELLSSLEELHRQELAFFESEKDRLVAENTSLRQFLEQPLDAPGPALPRIPVSSQPMALQFDAFGEDGDLPKPPHSPRGVEELQDEPKTVDPGEQDEALAGEEAASPRSPGMRPLPSFFRESSEAISEANVDKTCMQKLAAILVGDRYELLIGSLILANVFVMSFEFQFLGYRTGHEIEFARFETDPDMVWAHADDVFYYMNVTFTIIFVVDVAVRVIVLQLAFWRVPANWLDFVVVVSGVIELTDVEMSVNAVFLRLLRLAKLARALRVMRLTKVLESLHLLLKCIKASVGVLFWSLCVLGIIQCIAGMIISQIVKPYLDDWNIEPEERRKVFRYYGTFTKTLLTMFEVLFANWAPACRILVDNVSDSFIAVFIFYRCLVGFAILNVVNAVFIQQTMKVAQADQEHIIEQKQKAAEAYSKKLTKFFHTLDSSGDGHLSWDEFSVMLSDPKMKHWMGSLDLESHDMVNLFHMIDDGDGQISIDEFMAGAGRLKGPAKSVDVASCLTMMKRMEAKLDAMAKET